MAREKFLTIKLSICRMTDLSPADKLVLARIAGFKEYFESSKKCAELLGYTESTVKKIKQKLEKKGYITSVANTGRGKKYIAREDFRTNKPSKEKRTQKVEMPQIDTSMLKPSKGAEKKKFESFEEWKKKYPELIPALDACCNYLSRQQIPLLTPWKLRSDLVKTTDMFRNSKHPDAHVKVVLNYIKYLESREYLYQVENNKFCPVILSQDDLFRKFNPIREYKWDKSRHYDASKVLTRD